MSKNESLTIKAKAEIKKLGDVLNIPKTITTDQQYEEGRELYKSMRAHLKVVESRQAAILDPLKKSVNEVRALFRPVISSLEYNCDELATKLGSFANNRELERKKELERINSDQRLKRPETIQRLREEVAVKPEGTTRIQTLVIVDLEQIPREYWILDEVKIRRALLEGKEVPGAKLEEKLTVTIR